MQYMDRMKQIQDERFLYPIFKIQDQSEIRAYYYPNEEDIKFFFYVEIPIHSFPKFTISVKNNKLFIDTFGNNMHEIFDSYKHREFINEYNNEFELALYYLRKELFRLL